MPTVSRQPLIVGIGGTLRPGSTTEVVLALCMKEAEAAGATTRLLGGAFLASLPIFDPRDTTPTPAQQELCDVLGRADGVIVGTPGYHGSLSGMVKNALDTLEFTARDEKPYFQDKPVGVVVTAYGAQASGTTLIAVRSIIHAMRGWPTPFGAALNSTVGLFDEAGGCKDPKDQWQLATMAGQVVEFAKMRLNG
jgi:FMN reductase